MTPDVIAAVLADKLHLPADILTGNLRGMTRDRMARLESRLKSRIIGQDDAIESVCGRLLVAHAGVTERRGPLAVFLFAGPTGVGKTELAKALAEELLGGEKALIRLDMSEYMEPHSEAKLIGSPPGYVGYEEEGQLTGSLRRQPYSLVLLDEVEKAHPRVLDMFLQVFDEGRLTDAKGRTVDARNSLFIMTSNIRLEGKASPLGFDADPQRKQESELTTQLKKHFRPEFINRIGQTIVFRSLTRDGALAVARRICDSLAEHLLSSKGVHLVFTADALQLIVEHGYSAEFGVRQLQRVIEEQVHIPLARQILDEKKVALNQVVDVEEGTRLVIRSA